MLALNPQIVVDPKIGNPEVLNPIENRWSAAPTSGGGSSRSRVYQPYQPPDGEDETDPQAQQQAEEQQKSGTGDGKSKGRATANSEPAERLVLAERVALEEVSEGSDQGRGRSGGKSNCRRCGTELPAAQQEACPVCAQSGPDVIATVSVNYRFAGSKFLAAADSVAASSTAQGVMEQGAGELVSLRYKPKIPGHKDFLRFRAT